MDAGRGAFWLLIKGELVRVSGLGVLRLDVHHLDHTFEPEPDQVLEYDTLILVFTFWVPIMATYAQNVYFFAGSTPKQGWTLQCTQHVSGFAQTSAIIPRLGLCDRN